MKNDTFYPLFSEDTFDQAAAYLAEGMINSDQVRIMNLDIQKEQMTNVPNSLAEMLFRDICMNIVYDIYGQKNIVNVANYKLVQEHFNKRIKDYMLNYMAQVGLDATLISYTPSTFTIPAIMKQAKESNFRPYKAWDPSKEWNLHVEPHQLRDQQLAMTHPLNHFEHTTLHIKNIKNENFLFRLGFNGVISMQENINNKWSFDTLEVKLLPSNNFIKIMILMKALFEYY